MSIEVAIICDGCGFLIAQGKTAAAARADVRYTGGRASLPGGKDLCRTCTER